MLAQDQMRNLPMPELVETTRSGIVYYTDPALRDATGVCVAFTGRAGGVSEGVFSELNLSTSVGDSNEAVLKNRAMLLDALDGDEMPLIVPKQVHGSDIVHVAGNDAMGLMRARRGAETGADGLIVSVDGVAALLGFADCIPVIVVSPSGTFAVVHAGWRGVVSRIVSKAIAQMHELDTQSNSGDVCDISTYNVYIGPHIKACCFEVGEEVRQRFVSEFGDGVLAAGRNVDMDVALLLSLEAAGIDQKRIAFVAHCTMCEPEAFFSYRASGGECGRHGAIAFRKA